MPLSKPLTLERLLELLQIQLSLTTCCGTTQKQEKCKVKLSGDNQKKITPATHKLLNTWNDGNSISDSLFDLSDLIFCPRFHRSQATNRVAVWKTALPVRDNAHKDKHSTATRRISSSKNSDEDVPSLPSTSSVAWGSKTTEDKTEVKFRKEETKKNTRRPSAIISQCHIHAEVVTGDLSKATTCKYTQSSDISQRTRSKTTFPVPTSTKQPLSAFEPFSAVLTKNCKPLLQKLKAPISQREKDSGWVYIFKRPGLDTMVKVGTTINHPSTRLRQIGNPCQYTPTLLFAMWTPHAMKVERLVHCYLNKERRRENLSGGKCNEGKGCHKRHQEWFEVDLTYVKDVVSLWGNWMKTGQPYGGDGNLTTQWLVRLQNLSHTQLDNWSCWHDFANMGKKDIEQHQSSTVSTKSHKVEVATELRNNEVEDDVDIRAMICVTSSTTGRCSARSAARKSFSQSIVAPVATYTISQVSTCEKSSSSRKMVLRSLEHKNLPVPPPCYGPGGAQIGSLTELNDTIRDRVSRLTVCIARKPSLGRTIAAC
jgi:hypothetical protein